jgi:hypothetical protein
MKHRYLAILLVPSAVIFPALGGHHATIAHALKGLGVASPNIAAQGQQEFNQEYTFERETALTAPELATLRAAIEAQFSRHGANVKRILYAGPNDAAFRDPFEADEITAETRLGAAAVSQPQTDTGSSTSTSSESSSTEATGTQTQTAPSAPVTPPTPPTPPTPDPTPSAPPSTPATETTNPQPSNN